MTNDNLKSIKNRIRALTAKTVENGCTEHEAMAAAVKVGQLLNEYNLNIGDVVFGDETFVSSNVNVNFKKRPSYSGFVVGVSKFTQTKVWWDKKQNSFFYFGADTDVEMAVYLTKMIINAILYETEQFKKTSVYEQAFCRRSSYVNFQKGMSNRIYYRLIEMADKNNTDHTVATGKDIVIIKMAVVERKFKEQTDIKLKKAASSKSRFDGGAYKMGSMKGETVNLNRPLRNNAENIIRIGR